jgi:hypothetical protein
MDFQSFKDKHPRLEDRLTKLEKKSKIAEILLDLKDHEGMKMLLKELEGFVNAINVKLLSGERMEVEEREKLLTDKERCMWLASVFSAQETIQKNTKDYLKKL